MPGAARRDQSRAAAEFARITATPKAIRMTPSGIGVQTTLNPANISKPPIIW